MTPYISFFDHNTNWGWCVEDVSCIGVPADPNCDCQST